MTRPRLDIRVVIVALSVATVITSTPRSWLTFRKDAAAAEQSPAANTVLRRTAAPSSTCSPTLYIVSYDGAGSTLRTYDPVANTTSLIASLSPSVFVKGMDFAADGTLYAVTTSSSPSYRWARIDPETGVVTDLGGVSSDPAVWDLPDSPVPAFFHDSFEPMGFRVQSAGDVPKPWKLFKIDSMTPPTFTQVPVTFPTSMNYTIGLMAVSSTYVKHVTQDAVYDADLTVGSPAFTIKRSLAASQLSTDAAGTRDPSTGKLDVVDGNAFFTFGDSSGDTSVSIPALSMVTAVAWRPCPRGGVRVDPSTVTVPGENEKTASFTAVLTAPPAADVTVTFTSSDTSQGTVSPSTVTFTPANYATPQTITITSHEDPLHDVDAPYTVTATTSSSDSSYNSRLVQTVKVTNTPDDVDPLHFVVTAPASATAGVVTSFTVTAYGATNDPYPFYSGTVHFTSSDSQAVLPADAAITNGSGTFAATLKTAGVHTITATDTVTASTTGTSGAIAVAPAAATHLVLSSQTAAIAGTPFNLAISAVDPYGNVDSSYAGTIHLTSSDAQAQLPSDFTLTSGSASANVTLRTPGSQTISATGSANALSATTSPIAVSVGVVTHFAVSMPASSVAGSSLSLSVTAKDAANNTITTYGGTLHFSSTDGLASLPADTTLSNGTGTFNVVLKTAGTQSILVADMSNGAINGTTAGTSVSAAAPSLLSVVAPSSAVAGSSFNIDVTAVDIYGNTATSYSGIVHLTSTDSQAILGSDAALSNGAGTFAVTLKTAGTRTVTARDTVTASITGTSGSIALAAAAATHLTVSVPGTTTAGTPLSITVSARDGYENVDSSYAGTVHLSSSDSQAVLSTDTPLSSGTATMSATLKTAGTQSVTASVTGLAASPSTVAVSAGSVSHFAISAPSNSNAGTSFNFTVTAADAFGNMVPGYGGTVQFTSSDWQAVLPANSTLTGGTKTFAATLKTAGAQTITATDTASGSLNGSSSTNVAAGPATHFLVSGPGAVAAGTATAFSVGAVDDYDNLIAGYAGTVHFTSSDNAAVLPADTALSGGFAAVQVTLKTAGTQTLTATDTANNAMQGSTSTSVTAGPVDHLAIAVPSAATAGTTFNFTASARDAFGNVATTYGGTLHFTSTDAQAQLPADGALTNGSRQFSATMMTAGNWTIAATDTVTAALTVTSAVIPVSAPVCTYSLSASGTTAGAGGLSSTFTVTAPNLCQWSASSDSVWLTTAASGSGNGQVSFTAAPNSTTSGRVGTITVGGQAFVVTQSGVAPSNLVASSVSPVSIALSWTATAVDHFEVWRNAGSGFVLISTSASFNGTNGWSYADTVSSNAAYVYEVRAVDGGAHASPYSNLDLATTFQFSDDPLVAGVTTIKAAHATELMTAVNIVRNLAGLSSIAFTDPVAPGATIRISQINDLRNGLDAARSKLNLTPVAYTPLSSGSIVGIAGFTEIRDGVK